MSIDKKLIQKLRNLNRGIKIRKLPLAEASIFVKCMNNYYSRKKTNDYFRWQFYSYPKSIYFGAFDKKRYIGGFGIQLQKVKYYNDIVIVGKGLDLIVDPHYQNRGIGALLVLNCEKWAKEKKASAIMTLSNINGQRLLSRMNYKFKTIYQMEKNLKGRIKKFNLSKYHKIKAKRNEKFYFLKNDQWYTWRFFQNPEYKYSQINISDELRVFVKIFKDPETQKSFGDIVEVSNTKNIDLLWKAYTEAERFFKQKSVSSITTWALPNTLNFKITGRLGFKEVAKQRYFCIRILNKNIDLENFDSWFLMQSDSEIY